MAELGSAPVHSIPSVKQPGAIPSDPGFYAWWCDLGGLPGVPVIAHAREDLGLLYVGIAPRDASSSARLRSRLLRQHIGGNVASSTFRFGLAALLWESRDWTPGVSRSGKFVLDADGNRSLSSWQTTNLRLSYAVVTAPWRFEAAVIEAMRPPMNRGHNANHPFYAQMGAARDRFRACAQPGPLDPEAGDVAHDHGRRSQKTCRLEFTSAEISEIRRLLVEIRSSDRDAQKSLRAKLRRIGFHISDVSHENDGFTVSDFDALLRRGTVTQRPASVGDV